MLFDKLKDFIVDLQYGTIYERSLNVDLNVRFRYSRAYCYDAYLFASNCRRD